MLGTPIWKEMPLTHERIAASVLYNDVAVITLGRQAGEGEDRAVEDDFNLSAIEHEMINEVCEMYHGLGKKVIVVLNVGGVVETASWKDLPDFGKLISYNAIFSRRAKSIREKRCNFVQKNCNYTK